MSGTSSVFWGNGLGAFPTRTDLPNGFQPPGWPCTGDFNGDGIFDLANCGGDLAAPTVSTWLSSPSGTFSPRRDFPVGNAPSSVLTTDFNHDGFLDLANANQPDHTFTVLLGDGTGGFGLRRDFPTGLAGNLTDRTWGIAAGDFNRDGNLDLAVSTAGETESVVSIHYGDGTGNFSLATNVPTGGYAREVAVGDFNGDGILDLATPSLVGCVCQPNADQTWAGEVRPLKRMRWPPVLMPEGRNRLPVSARRWV